MIPFVALNSDSQTDCNANRKTLEDTHQLSRDRRKAIKRTKASTMSRSSNPTHLRMKMREYKRTATQKTAADRNIGVTAQVTAPLVSVTGCVRLSSAQALMCGSGSMNMLSDIAFALLRPRGPNKTDGQPPAW